MKKFPVILGPTACGKTAVAARLAFELNGEVISADSRQVYRGMDIGSGKDLGDYVIEEKPVPVHLVDIADPGYEYNIFEYQRDFYRAFAEIVSRGKLPVLCGGSGMYLEAVLKGYSLPEAPHEPLFALRMQSMSDTALLNELGRLKKLHSTTDTVDRVRMLRALEIEFKRRESGGEKREAKSEKREAKSEIIEQLHHGNQSSDLRNPGGSVNMQTKLISSTDYVCFGINPGREIVRQRITERLQDRLGNGMTEEVRSLIEQGVPHERLRAYGLEYKYISLYLAGELGYDDMFRLLNTAIHQFAKRQMTWFRRMERQGMKIHWIEGEMPSADKVIRIREILEQNGHWHFPCQ